MYYLKIFDLNIGFKSWYNVALWEPLRWKLDPFLIKGNVTGEMDILVEKVSGIEEKDLAECLYVESLGFFQWQIYKTYDGNMVWQIVRKKSQKIYLQYIVSSAWNKISLVIDETNTCNQVAFEYVGVILAKALLMWDVLVFHGVLLEYQGKGVVISADSGIGKTTHARLWRNNKNALIINGDRVVCKKVNGKWFACGVPWSGTSGEQINRTIPIFAMVVLERGEQNEADIIKGIEAFRGMLPHVQYPVWDTKLAGNAIDLLNEMLEEVPTVRLKCTPDVEAVETLLKVLEVL